LSASNRIVIIADDLTGALDSAAPFAKQGLVTRVAALPTIGYTGGVRSLHEAQVVAINTESRHLNATAAAAAVQRAVLDYAGSGAVLFKKIDSTLRGNVAAETVAAQRASGRRGVLFAPAFPAQGRLTRQGVVYVHGVPLAETEFVRDALSPAPREPIAVFMRQAAPQWVITGGSAQELGAQVDLSGDTVHLCIVDAQTQGDLECVVAAMRARLRDLLLVGSAGLSSALVKALAPREPVEQPVASALQGDTGITLFVVGSRAQKSREQAVALRAAGATTLEAPAGEVNEGALETALGALPARGSLLILATQSEDHQTQAELVAQRLAHLCVRVLARCDVRTIVATGGDTAKAILQATDNPVVEVCGELIPGIALARFRVDGREYGFITKAGGFGAADTFVSIREHWDERRAYRPPMCQARD
jgi:uncharacterized protein YgbK (DUF1537 family)